MDEACSQQQLQTPSLPLVTAIHVALKKSLHLFLSLPLHSQNEEDLSSFKIEGKKEVKSWS